MEQRDVVNGETSSSLKFKKTMLVKNDKVIMLNMPFFFKIRSLMLDLVFVLKTNFWLRSDMLQNLKEKLPAQIQFDLLLLNNQS